MEPCWRALPAGSAKKKITRQLENMNFISRSKKQYFTTQKWNLYLRAAV